MASKSSVRTDSSSLEWSETLLAVRLLKELAIDCSLLISEVAVTNAIGSLRV